MSPPTVSEEPTERLGRILGAAIKAIEAHPEFGDDVRVVLMADTDTSGTVAASGYDDQADMVVDMLGHLHAAFEAAGVKMRLLTVPKRGRG